MKIDDLALRSATDETFRAALIADPRAALTAEGVDLPEAVTVRVVESTPDHIRIAIPPALNDDVELDEEALAGVAGGTTLSVIAFTVSVGGGYAVGKFVL